MTFATTFEHYLDKAGEIGQYVIPAAAAGYAIYNGDYAEAGLMCLMGMIQKAELVFLKTSFPTMRPNRTDRGSFPSGHTASAFLGVGLLSTKYGLSLPACASLVGATVIGFSRFYNNHRWPLNIFAGAYLGMMNGYMAGVKFKFY